MLTNGKNVGARAGSPSAPGALAAGASTLPVRAGQGVRLELVNASAIRYFRLRLTDNSGTLVPLIRVGGEGGLLDNAVEEGGTQGTWVTGYDSGEILLPPGSRADVVAAVPASATGVLTMWTEDYQRTGAGFADVPTVPVMHLAVTGTPVSPAYSISAGTPLRAATGDPVPVLGPPTGTLLNPATFSPPKLGNASQTITFTNTGGAGGTIGVDGTSAPHDIPNYRDGPAPGQLDAVREIRRHAAAVGHEHARCEPSIPPAWVLDPANLAVQRAGRWHTDVHVAVPRVPRQRRHSRVFRHGPHFHAHVPAADRSPPAARRGHARRRARPVAVPLPHLLPRDARHALRARRRPGQRQGAPRHQRQHGPGHGQPGTDGDPQRHILRCRRRAGDVVLVGRLDARQRWREFHLDVPNGRPRRAKSCISRHGTQTAQLGRSRSS